MKTGLKRIFAQLLSTTTATTEELAAGLFHVADGSRRLDKMAGD